MKKIMIKKSLSLILALLMVVSCMGTMMFTVSATETQFDETWIGISSLSELPRTASDTKGKKYYLLNDIGSEDAPITETKAAFGGTLDGNGKTIYTSVPVFNQLGNGAIVKNLKLAGNIELSYYGGSLAVLGGLRKADSTITLENVTNYATIQQNTNQTATGGLIGYLYGAINATNCENHGAITTNNTANYQIVGGLVGKVADGYPTEESVFENCGNYANITVSTKGYIILGGIAGQMSNTNNKTFISCENTGILTATESGTGEAYVGGIVGKHTETTGNYTYINCKNSGNISLNAGNSGERAFVGGISGGRHLSNIKAYNCANDGDISVTNATGTTRVAGIASHSSDDSKFVFCKNSGALSGPDDYTFQITTRGVLTDYAAGETTVSFEGVQRSLAVAGETTFSMRIISEITNINKYSATGVKVYYTESGKSSIKYTDKATQTVYTQIGYIENEESKAYPEVEKASTYYSALTVTEIPVTGKYTFVVVPYTQDLEGNYTYADAYSVTVTNGVVAEPVAFN